MAFVDPSEYVTRQVPHEPGEWVKIRRLMTDDLIALQKRPDEDTPTEQSIEMIRLCVSEWSWARPIDEASLKVMDPKTFRWLDNEVMVLAGLRAGDEKNASEPPSSATSGRGRGGSRQSSATS